MRDEQRVQRARSNGSDRRRGSGTTRLVAAVMAFLLVVVTLVVVPSPDARAAASVVRTVTLRRSDKGKKTITMPCVERGQHYFEVFYKGSTTTGRSDSKNTNYFTVR